MFISRFFLFFSFLFVVSDVVVRVLLLVRWLGIEFDCSSSIGSIDIVVRGIGNWCGPPKNPPPGENVGPEANQGQRENVKKGKQGKDNLVNNIIENNNLNSANHLK